MLPTKGLAAFTILMMPVVIALPANDPGMFRGGPAHLGVYQSASPTLKSVLWKFKTSAPVISSPLVIGETVFVGSNDGSLYALARGDGLAKWKFSARGPVNSSPAYRNGVVFVGSVDGRMYAIDAATGKQKWVFATQGERRFSAPGIHGAMPRHEIMPDPFDVFLSSPTVVDDVLYFGSGDHNVYALDAETGTLKWEYTTGNVVHASPAVSNGIVYVGSWDTYMHAIDASTGKTLWKFQTGSDTITYNQVGIASSAAVANGIVYFGCRDGHFYAVDAKTGALKWKHDNKGGWVIGSPAVRNNVVYFPTADGTRFKALNATTGELLYSIENKALSFSSPVIVNNSVYFGSSDGWMHELDLPSGKLVAEFQSDGSKENASKYTDANGKFISAALYPDLTLDGVIIGVHRMFTLGSFLSSPAVADGILYIGSADGNVYALR